VVWFALIMFVASFVLSQVLAPKPDIENARPSKLGDIRFPRATAGAPMPVIFGKVRLRAPNTIWFGAFKATAQTVKVKTGLFTSKDQITGYQYGVSMDLALCCGPDVTLDRIWAEKQIFKAAGAPLNGDGVLQTINQINLFGGPAKGGGMAGRIRFYSGGFTQARNAYIANRATNGADYPGYPGTCHIVFENRIQTIQMPFGLPAVTITTPFYIGTAAQLRALSFELSRYPNNLGLGANRLIGDDLNPAEIIYSLLVEAWGGLGIAAALIDTTSFTAAGTTLKAEGNGASIIVASSQDASSVVQELLRQADGILYQDPATGKVAMKLIRADYSIPSLPVFDETNVESVENFSRTSWAETINQVRVTYNSRSKKYVDATAFVQDMANISMQARIRSADLQFPGVTTEAQAVTIGTRELSYLSVPLFRATLRTTRAASALKPGDAFVLSWAEYGLVQIIMRVQSFDFGELANGNVVMQCVQDKFAVASTVYAAPIDPLDDPGANPSQDIVKYQVFESPYIFVNRLEDPFTVQVDSSYFWALARDPNGRHDGYDFLTSDDNFVDRITTELNHTFFPYSCELVGAVHRTQAQDDGILAKIVVRLPNPEGAVFATSAAADIRTKGEGLLFVNGEFMAYEAFVDNGDGTYDLTTVHRALLDTTFKDHVDGDIVYLLTGVEWLSQVANADTGTLYYQLLSFTAQDAQALGDFATQTFARAQRYDLPLPPDLMEVEGLRAPIEVIDSGGAVDITAFLERDRTDPDEFVLLADSTDTPEASTTYTARLYLDGVLLATSTALTHAGLPFTLSGLFGSGLARVELEAVRAVGASFTVDWAEFFYALYLSLSAERLTNGNFEASLGTGWTTISGSWSKVTTVYPLDAVRVPGASGDDEHAETVSGTPAELRQEYTIPGADDGKSAIFRIWKGGKGAAVGQVIIELRDATTALKTITTPNVAAATVGKWELLEVPLSLRTDATMVRVRLLGTGAGSVWDNASLKNHTTSPSATLTYDTVTGVTPQGVWALRKADSGYSGALVRIRDTFDDAEQDVGFDPDGNLEPFFVRGQARVVKWYDQSGNGVDLTAASNAKQPRLMWNLTETGRAYVDFAGGCALRDPTAGTTRPYMTTRPNLVMALGPKRDSSAAFLATIPHQDASHSSPFYRWGLATAGTDYRWSVDGTEENDAGNSAINSGKHVVCIDYQNGNFYENDDATAADTFTAANITYPNSTRLRLGEDPVGGNPWTGTLSELCIYDGNVANGDRQTIMEALGLYWYNLAV
jgi:Putative phage tail protein